MAATVAAAVAAVATAGKLAKLKNPASAGFFFARYTELVSCRSSLGSLLFRECNRYLRDSFRVAV